MDFAPFPSISNIGYAEIAAVNYDLPCKLRGRQVPKMVSYDNSTFQMSFWRKSFVEGTGLKKTVADSRILLRPKRCFFLLLFPILVYYSEKLLMEISFEV